MEDILHYLFVFAGIVTIVFFALFFFDNKNIEEEEPTNLGTTPKVDKSLNFSNNMNEFLNERGSK